MLRMDITRPRFARLVDRLLGYLGLFLIGVIGWSCDTLAALRTAKPSGAAATG